MFGIKKIIIKSDSGTIAATDTYRDRLEITKTSIKYQSEGFDESKERCTMKWSFKTESEAFDDMYFLTMDHVAYFMREYQGGVIYTARRTITITAIFEDNKRWNGLYSAYDDETLDQFADMFFQIRQMVPATEVTPFCIRDKEYWKEIELEKSTLS